VSEVHYLISGPSHLPYLVVSIHSLRKWWDGSVIVHSWPESWEWVQSLEGDDRLGVRSVRREPRYRGKNATFLDQIRVLMEVGQGILMDADTLIVGDISDLISSVRQYPMVLTQFTNWTSGTGRIRGRVNRLKDVWPEDDPKAGSWREAQRFLDGLYPSVNMGICGIGPGGEELVSRWERATEQAIHLFIGDEIAANGLLPWFLDNGAVVLDGRFNCSPVFGPGVVRDVRIWHFHGDSNTRPVKCWYGVDLWMPVFWEVVSIRLGGVDEWWDKVANKYLNKVARDSRFR